MRIEEMSLEEKVDEILRHLRRAHRTAIIKSFISIALFVILVVIPLVGFYYWFRDFQQEFGMSLEEIGETLNKAKDITDIEGVDDLKSLLQ